MKALIVDNEKHVRDAVRLLANWQSLGIDTVLEAEDGVEAKAIIEAERPQIVITDMMMPISSGLDLLEWIQLHEMPCKTIILSGHNDFEFVRHTIKHGGLDYLLKPIDPFQLEHALRKAAESWRQEDRARADDRLRTMEMNQIKPVYRDKLLSTLLNNAAEYSALRDQLVQHFPGLKEAVDSRIMVLSLDTMEQAAREKFAYRLDLLFFTLINISNEFLDRRRCGTAFRYWNSESEVILLLWGYLAEAEAVAAEISRGITRALRTRFDFGLGLVKSFPSGLQDSYKEARTALRNRNLLEMGSRITVYRENDRPNAEALHLTDFEEHIRIAIRSGRDDQIEEAVGEWIEAVRGLGRITVAQLELWGHEYNVIKARWVQDFFKDEKVELRLPSEGAPYIVPMDEQGRISITLWQQELTESMKRLASRVRQRQQQEGNVIFDIARYLEQHYARELTLQQLADQFFLSREYISRKFKQQLGENMVDFLSRIRVDKSKLLLLNPLLKIADVAQSVGYQDEKYFSKVFKKLEGVSPNEYRKTMKLVESLDTN
ncbi:response regulator [Paenibacillus koleovorans]|uniref:response regulator n=1 Tax=Paenibacillus koleovorans TaxID=121608 RepID=UPI000FD7E571|nr:response regulator [Paenibacillus koleovorans]